MEYANLVQFTKKGLLLNVYYNQYRIPTYNNNNNITLTSAINIKINNKRKGINYILEDKLSIEYGEERKGRLFCCLCFFLPMFYPKSSTKYTSIHEEILTL